MAAVDLGVMLRDTGELAEARTHLERRVAIFHDIADRAGLTEAPEEPGSPRGGRAALARGAADPRAAW